MRITNPVIINKQLVSASFKETKPDALRRFMEETRTSKFNFSQTGIADKLFMQLEDVRIEKAPEGVVEVYLNLKRGVVPNAKSRSFAGVLDLFTATGQHAQHGDGGQISASIYHGSP